jgi:6,7-dimethyl-8-ribityllumazine synthase
MTSGQDMGRYDPFEDTGDWPFRDAPPRPEEGIAEELPAEELRSTAADAVENTALAAPPERDVPTSDDVLEPMAEAEEMVQEVVEADASVAPEQIASAVSIDPEEVGGPDQDVSAEDDTSGESEPGSVEHALGTLAVPPSIDVLSGGPHGFRRNVAVVVSRFNGDITTGLLESALTALRECNVADDAITVVPVPGAFELPLTALALAKTRRFSCVVALGCVIRGETAHFDLIAGETASGLQLAAIETGIPVSFGVIACETREQATARVDRGAEAARTALEMADLFSHVRTRAAAT